jgi:periplasmic divalent cation tolerance protein
MAPSALQHSLCCAAQSWGCSAIEAKIIFLSRFVDQDDPMSARFLYVTAANTEEAGKIGEALVRERLAACANILGPVASIYWWQGKMQRESEAVLVAKTRADLVDQVIARVKALHSYTVPCVVSLAIEQGNQEFLRWIEAETAPSGAQP